jgi:methionyl aminopeptidase
MVTRKSRREIEKMRHAGRIVAEVLALVESELKPGVTTGHLDRIAEKHIRDEGAVPSFLGYGHRSNPFPASLCISIDDEVVHGIPGDRVIREGQVVSVDAGAIYDGWHGDGARTFFVGEPKPGVGELIDTTRLAMMAGIARRSPAPISATSRPRSRTSPGRTATASSASSSATGSAPRCTRSRRSPTTGPASGG